MASAAEAETIDAAGTAAQGSVMSTMSGSFVLNIVLASKMDKVWSILNSLQIVELIRLFDIMTPGNINAFTQFFEMITSVKLFDSEELLSDWTYIPEMDPQSLNFQNAGYDTTLFILNASSFIVIYALQLSLLPLILLVWGMEKICKCARRIRNKLEAIVFWNSSIRVFMSGYIDICLFSMINIAEILWIEGLDIVKASNIMSYSMVIICSLVPFVLLGHAFLRRKDFQKPSFMKRVGTWIDGMKMASGEMIIPIICYAMLFFIRRVVLCLTLVFWADFFFGQLLVQFIVSMTLLIVINVFHPLQTKFATRIETFNEATNIFVLYLLMLFSDFNHDYDQRSNVGTVYIGVVIFFAVVHLQFMIVDSIKQLI